MTARKQRLTDEQIKKSTDAYKSVKDKKTAIRIDCVILWGKGYDWAVIEDVLMISVGLIHDAVNKYKFSGIAGLTESHYEGHNYKMTGELRKSNS